MASSGKILRSLFSQNHSSRTTHRASLLIAAIILFLFYIFSQSKTNKPKYYNLTNYSKPFTSKLIGEDFWKSFQPSASCSSNFLEKIGQDIDGYKWMCGLFGLTERESCTVYSFGVRDDSSFEAEVLATTKHCEVFAFDPSVNFFGRPLQNYNPRAHFFKVGIGGSDNEAGNVKTLQTLMNECGHEFLDILKLDVEGAELPSLKRVLTDFEHVDTLPIGQLLVELHLFERSSKLLSELQTVLERLESKGLRLFYVQTNESGTKGCCADLSFINIHYRDRFFM